MDSLGVKPSINLFCEFRDKELEAGFSLQEMNRSKKYLRPVIILFGILNTLFLIPDHAVIGKNEPIYMVMGARAVFLAMIVCLFFLISNSKKPGIMAAWITAGEAAGFANFILVFWEYPDPDFLIQVLGLIILILITYLMPNRWLHMNLVALVGSVCFFAVSVFKLRGNPEEFSAGAVYTAIVIVIIGYFSFRMNYFNRVQFHINKKLEVMSSTDPLTGLLNKAKLYEELRTWIIFSKRYRTPLALVLFDVDDFKRINDQFGHLTGDKVISSIADIVAAMVRVTDKLARWGGDEFVMLLPHTNRQQAFELAERIRKNISVKNLVAGETITCSFGVAVLNGSMKDMDNLISAADEALYKAKSTGKNVVMY
ncbi:MAG TPA: GGDEF domain-containing protein [Clostridia bacterium]|nr:GGDEF domain-containing protein [Clostridia bacterium]